MNISYNWLCELIDLNLSPEETAEKLTLIGLEVESVSSYGSDLNGVVVGKVLSVTPHPNADRLKVCNVDLGISQVQIVCGADNVAQDQLVPVATVGTTLPVKLDDGSFLTLRKAKLRGEVSEGMICAEDELGLGSDHSGIMVLEGDHTPGTPIREVLNVYTDTIIDIAITPNRPDATCHIGVARDLAAALHLPFNADKPEPKSVTSSEGQPVGISIHNPEKCNRYAGLVVSGVQIGESPMWLKNRLKALGLRAVNNVVDVTNYVMYEMGQPLHAFDLDLLGGKNIVVKDFDQAVEFETLDHVKRTCEPGTLFICDDNGPVAVAGVMGGLHSEVSNTTTNILIESAYFDPGTIRSASKKLTLQTDSSYRFERGIDPEMQAIAAQRAGELITQVAGGTISGPCLDIHPVKHKRKELTLRTSYVNRLLGTELTTTEISTILNGLGMELLSQNEELLSYRIPGFRPDLEREVDLIEEVGRLFDYNRIGSTGHGIYVSSEPFSEREQLRTRCLETAVQLGFREIYTNSLISDKEASVYGSEDEMIRTLNPLTKDMTTLRPSLLHGFLKASAYNFNRGASGVRFFEFGNVFRHGENARYHKGIQEQTHLLFGISGYKNEEHWTGKPESYSFFDLKSDITAFFKRLRLDSVNGKENDSRLDLYSGDRLIGHIQEVPVSLKKVYEIDGVAYVAELNIDAIEDLVSVQKPVSFSPIAKFPPFEFDIALILNKDVPASDIMNTIRKDAGDLLQHIDIFDVFESEKLGSDKKSIAFRLIFLDHNKTLNINDVEPIIDRVVSRLESTFDAKLRG